MPDPTPQQEAIYDAVRHASGNVLVEALAGTGKTTTAVGAAACAPPGTRVGFAAFNRHIAEELQHRLGSSAKATTMHSLGFAAVKRQNPKCVLDEKKLFRLSKAACRDLSFTDSQFVTQLARLCKYTLTTVNNDFSGDITDDSRLQLQDLVDHFGMEEPLRPEKAFAAVGKLLELCKLDLGAVDFDDMIWFPVVHNLGIQSFDLLLVDEAQDLNACQQTLAMRASAGPMMPIGDRRQAIYGFSGSDPDALLRLANDLDFWGGCKRLPLTVTWRCPASHVHLAQQLVPELESAPSAADGEILAVHPKHVAQMVKPGDMVLCRANAPLVDLVYALITAGVPARMRGRDIGAGLLRLVTELAPTDLDDLADKLLEYQRREERRLIDRDASSQSLQSLKDRCDCLAVVISRSRDIAELERFLVSVFDDAKPDQHTVILSSVHRAKGLESDRVFILQPERMPMVTPDQKAWEYQQELNILYVALTRAKQTLVFAGEVPSVLRGDSCRKISAAS